MYLVQAGIDPPVTEGNNLPHEKVFTLKRPKPPRLDEFSTIQIPTISLFGSPLYIVFHNFLFQLKLIQTKFLRRVLSSMPSDCRCSTSSDVIEHIMLPDVTMRQLKIAIDFFYTGKICSLLHFRLAKVCSKLITIC